MADRLSHVDARGRVRMVDVGGKAVTDREAVARGHITIAPAALRLIRRGAIAKGDPLQTARLAGIMAAKRTASLIPLYAEDGMRIIEVRSGWMPRRTAFANRTSDRSAPIPPSPDVRLGGAARKTGLSSSTCPPRSSWWHWVQRDIVVASRSPRAVSGTAGTVIDRSSIG